MTQRTADMTYPNIYKILIFCRSLENGYTLNPGFGKNGFPGVVFFAGHVVFGVVTGNGHKGHQIRFFDFILEQYFPDVLSLRITLHRACENVGIFKLKTGSKSEIFFHR